MTIREQATEKLYDATTDMLKQEHEQNYVEWYVDRDGEIMTEEFVDQNSWLQGDDILPVIKLGCGSVPCNCDWCSGPDAVHSVDDIDFESDAYDTMQNRIDDAINNIPIGFFNDEE